MNTQLATTELQSRMRRSARTAAVSAIGPLTAAAGIVWALVQPYRLTLLDPGGRGFWALAVQAPLLVILVGALFHFLLVPGLVRDLNGSQER